MDFRIILAGSRFALIALALAALGGCAKTPTPPPLPQLTQLPVREMQIREYSGTSEPQVMKAVIAAFMDQGFMITSTDQALGLISAAKEVHSVDQATKGFAEFNLGPGAGTYQTTLRSEASSVVVMHGKAVRVRISIVQKSVSNAGGNIWSQPLYDSQGYQAIFTKVDKSIFWEKEKL